MEDSGRRSVDGDAKLPQSLNSGEPRYVFRDVPAGRYRLLIDRLGYARLVDSVTVRPDAIDTLQRQLRFAYGCDLDCGEVTFRKPRPWWLRWWPF